MARLTQAQIDLHRTCLGGSGAPMALGFSKWMSARHLYHCMRGEMPFPKVDPVMTELGHAFENVIIEKFEREILVDDKPAKVIRRRKTYRHRRYKNLICHLDGALREVPHILEVKLRGDSKGEDWGPDGSEQIPMDVEIQCRHNMEVSRKEACWVGVFFLMQREYRFYCIERDADAARDILKAERLFLECVANGTPPDWDFTHRDTADVLKRLFPGTNGGYVKLPEELWHYHRAIQDAGERIAALTKIRDEARNVIRWEMGENAIADLPDGTSYVRARRTSSHGTPYMALEHRKHVRAHERGD